MNRGHVKVFLGSPTGRLSLTYLAVIMFMSVGFSIVLYNASSNQLGRHLPPPSYTDSFKSYQQARIDNSAADPGDINQFLRQRIDEGRNELMADIVLMNIAVLLVGSGVSYHLARQTLRPIEAALVSKDRFISDASHELRTPLTALRITNEVALRKKTLSTSETKSLLGENVNEAKRLQALTDGLLGLLKEENAVSTAAHASLQELVGDSMSKVVAQAQTKKISVDDMTPNWRINTTPDAFGQIITILLDNAIKYSPTGSKVVVKAEKEAKYFKLLVEDQGAGIKASDLPHIFDRFYRADSSRTKQTSDGYGLGLAIAQKLAGSLGGEISAKSTLGKGSTFTLQLSSGIIELA